MDIRPREARACLYYDLRQAGQQLQMVAIVEQAVHRRRNQPRDHLVGYGREPQQLHPPSVTSDADRAGQVERDRPVLPADGRQGYLYRQLGSRG